MSDETTSATEPSPADLQRLQALWHGFRVSQALYVAASLGLADLLADGPKSADALAATTGANADALYRVLRALASIGVFAETTERHFTLTPMARLLRQDHPYSVRAQVIYLGDEPYRAWGNLLPSVMSGANAYQQVFGMPHFQYLAQHPAQNEVFN
ncbi:MAG TPA: methyltransferase dimerization domain-containing protein, partial [Ktedonobacterales bacterium]